MPKLQPSFTAEFKQEAVQLTKTSDKPKAQIARELGISDSALYSWCKAAEAHGEEALRGLGHQLPLEEEIHRRTAGIRADSAGARHLKKSHQHLLTQPAVKYQFMAEYCGDYPVTVMCHVLEVSVSGDSAWHKREPSQHSREDADLAAKVKTAFEHNRRVYGSPRIHAELHAQGMACGQKRVARLMRELGISAQLPKHRTVTTHSEKGAPVAANLLQQDFHADRPNQKWTTDTTYIWTKVGWLYLAVVLDLFSRMVVGWSMAAIQDATLVVQALQMALARRRPEAELVHHSDRGSTYTSESYLELVQENGMVSSMSRTANCYDNAVTESLCA